MRIQLLDSVVGNDFVYAKGQIVDVPEERGKDLVKGAHAVQVGAPAPKPEAAIERHFGKETRKK